MKLFDEIIYRIIFGGWYLISLLPFCVHYFFSDLLQLLLFHVVKYRRKVVHENMRSCFPDKTDQELLALERNFYAHFCDLIVEQVKYFSISEKEMKKRMTFKNLEAPNESCRNGRSCAFFLGHYCNWEWIASTPMWVDERYVKCAQLYHPLENKALDRIMGYIRGRFGGVNIPVEQSLRHIVKCRKDGQEVIVGFIADQVPLYTNIHYWTNFLNHPQTPVFSGAEKIIKMFNMDVYFLHVRKVKRGYYEVDCQLMMRDSKNAPEFAITELYTRLLEQNILEDPALWLWTHRRWKRTYEGWLQDIEENRQRHEEKMKKYKDDK